MMDLLCTVFRSIYALIWAGALLITFLIFGAILWFVCLLMMAYPAMAITVILAVSFLFVSQEAGQYE
jgi:hypothetical protein